MLQHPVSRVGMLALMRESSTWVFAAFVAAVIGLFMVLQGVGNAQQGGVFSEDDSILVVANGVAPRYPLPVRYAREIAGAGIEGVRHVAAVNFVPATMDGDRRRVAAMAADPEDLLLANTDLVVLGKMAEQWTGDRMGLLVGSDLAQQEGIRIGDSIALTSRMFRLAGDSDTLKFRVSGMYSVRDQAYPALAVIMHDTVIRPFGQYTASQGASAILVLLESRRYAGSAAQGIDEKYARSPVETRTMLREQFVQAFSDTGAGLATLLRLYGLGGVAAGLMLLGTFCWFNAHRLAACWDQFARLGFRRLHIVLRGALPMVLVIVGSAAAGVGLTFASTTLFSVAIEQAFPLFEASAGDGLLLLGPVALLGSAASLLAMTLVTRPARRAVAEKRS